MSGGYIPGPTTILGQLTTVTTHSESGFVTSSVPLGFCPWHTAAIENLTQQAVASLEQRVEEMERYVEEMKQQLVAMEQRLEELERQVDGTAMMTTGFSSHASV